MKYAELHCLTNFSFLQAASHPDELIARAAALKYAALAVTDRHSVAGMARAYTATKDHPVPLIVGAEIRPVDAEPVVLWATSRRGYASLCSLITTGCRRAPKGECRLTIDDVSRNAAELIAGVLPPIDKEQFAAGDARLYREIFGHGCYLLAEFQRGPHDDYRRGWLQQLSRETSLPLVAAGNVLFHTPARKPLHDVLTAIRHQTHVDAACEYLTANGERYLHPPTARVALYRELPGAIERTLEIASQCRFCMSELKYEYPEELAPPGKTPIQHLRDLTWQSAAERYPQGVPAKVKQLLTHELQLIEELRYESYFLTTWDLVRFARGRGILCQGRGSAANSAVCYCLGITPIDPGRINVLFERFISRERDEAPDIDVDFEHERREEVLQYIYEKYGRERAGITAVTVTYRPRSAVRDVGKALGLSLDLVDRLAKCAGRYRQQTDFEERCQEIGFDAESETGQRFFYLVDQILGFPRHLSQHVGGMVITRGPLHELVPIENAAMDGRTVVQWNKDDLDDLGILKIDCLSLGMLTAIRKCFGLIEKSHGETWTMATVPPEDSATYDMICKADTVGVFQIESRAQMSMLPRLKPRKFYDLVIEVAIVRPGPIQGKMVHPYLKRRNGEEEPEYPNDAIRGVLEKTLGVPLFQEQCMQLAVVAAGFTPGEADQLRRAMGAWRRPGVIDQFHGKLLKGMKRHGLEGEFAERVFQQIRGFGEYGFPESHAASFAMLVYVSAWLKCHYPAEFTGAIINSLPMGFYAPAQLVRDVREHNVTVLPVDVNASHWDCTIEKVSGQSALRLGYRLVRGFQQQWATVIEQAREDGAFKSLSGFLKRTRLPRAQLLILAEADAFGALQGSRRESLWNALAADAKPQQGVLFDRAELEETTPQLPAMAPQEEVHADYLATGLSLRSHPMAFQREDLTRIGVITTAALQQVENNSQAKVAGIVLLRQRPSTAKGITFVTLEDETGIANLLFHIDVWEHNRRITEHSQAWIVHGRVETKDTVIHVIVSRIEDLTTRLEALHLKSRDFR